MTLKHLCKTPKHFSIFFLMLLLSHQAFAGFTNFSGNTRPKKTDGVDGTINFAVLYSEAASWDDTWGTGYRTFDRTFREGEDLNQDLSPPLDTGARFLYLYQLVNDGEEETPLNQLEIKRKANALGLTAPITSWGYFEGMGLANDQENTGELTAVSGTHTFGPSAKWGSPSPAVYGVVKNPAVVFIGDGEDAGLLPSSVILYPHAIQSNWVSAAIAATKRAVLFGFTSDAPPIKDWGTIKGFEQKNQ